MYFELDADAGIPSPQTRIAYETSVEELARIALSHLERVRTRSFRSAKVCEGEPLLRAVTIAAAIERIRARNASGSINLNTNGSMPEGVAALDRRGAGRRADKLELLFAPRFTPRIIVRRDTVGGRV